MAECSLCLNGITRGLVWVKTRNPFVAKYLCVLMETTWRLVLFNACGLKETAFRIASLKTGDLLWLNAQCPLMEMTWGRVLVNLFTGGFLLPYKFIWSFYIRR